MKRPSLNIVLETMLGIGVAGAVAVALAGWSWLWFGIAIGAVGGYLLAKLKHWQYWGAWRSQDKSRAERH